MLANTGVSDTGVCFFLLTRVSEDRGAVSIGVIGTIEKRTEWR